VAPGVPRLSVHPAEGHNWSGNIGAQTDLATALSKNNAGTYNLYVASLTPWQRHRQPVPGRRPYLGQRRHLRDGAR
jgi:hypothetical protein